MNTAWATKKGFTIIEMLVVIVVIGILATITIVSYNGIQQRSRDSERASDIVKLKIAIEKYHAEKGSYPSVCPSGDNSGCAISYLGAELQNYIDVIPHDPRNTLDSATDYRYVRGPVASDNYGILVTYEARDVCKTGANINPTWWNASIPTC